MDRHKKTQVEKMLVGGLLLFFVFTLHGSLKSAGILGARSAPKTAGVAVAQTANVVPAAPAAPPAAGRPVPAVARPVPAVARPTPALKTTSGYSANTVRDPLKSLLPKKPKTEVAAADVPEAAAVPDVPMTLPGLQLQGVWWTGEEGQALINGELYGIGDQVEGATITTIGRDGVMLQFAGAIFLLPVGKDPVQVGMPQGAR